MLALALLVQRHGIDGCIIGARRRAPRALGAADPAVHARLRSHLLARLPAPALPAWRRLPAARSETEC